MASTYKLVSTIIADDIRKENNGKEIIIGVYTGVIIVPTIPAILPTFFVRFEIKPNKLQYKKASCKILNADDFDFLTSVGKISIATIEQNASFSFRFSPLVIEKVGIYKIYLGMDGPIRKVSSFEVTMKGAENLKGA